MSNSKLNRVQKQFRREMLSYLKENGGYIRQNISNGRTVVVSPVFSGSRMVIVSVSNMSPDEQKFRRKVGEYYALFSMFEDHAYIQLPVYFDVAEFLNV